MPAGARAPLPTLGVVTDLGGTLLFAVSSVFLVVLLTGGVATIHTDTELPRAVTYGQGRQNLGRRAMLVEIPVLGLLIGGTTFVLVLMLNHPASTWVVRLVSMVALVAIAAWCAFLAQRLTRRR